VGLTDLRISIKAERIQYPESPLMQRSVWDLLPEDSPKNNKEKQMVLDTQRLAESGYLDRETVRLAIEERDAWYRNPDSFFFTLLVLAAGRKST